MVQSIDKKSSFLTKAKNTKVYRSEFFIDI